MISNLTKVDDAFIMGRRALLPLCKPLKCNDGDKGDKSRLIDRSSANFSSYTPDKRDSVTFVTIHRYQQVTRLLMSRAAASALCPRNAPAMAMSLPLNAGAARSAVALCGHHRQRGGQNGPNARQRSWVGCRGAGCSVLSPEKIQKKFGR